MKISILCSSKNHPVFPYLLQWKDKNQNDHDISVVSSSGELKSGDFLFLISCTEFINKETREKFKHSLVIHESDLPKGRGWSPLIWELLGGSNTITVSLLEAEEKIDSGDIWKKIKIKINDCELIDTINDKIFSGKLELVDFAIRNYSTVKPIKQNHDDATYYKKRTPTDNELDINKPLSEYFDLLRIADKKRYPCFFYFRNHKFKLFLEKYDE